MFLYWRRGWPLILWFWAFPPPGKFWLGNVTHCGHQRTLVAKGLKGGGYSSLKGNFFVYIKWLDRLLTLRRWESCLNKFVVGWFLDVIHECVRIWLVVNLLLGSTSSICLTKSLAKLDTVDQLPESMLYWPLPILRRMSSGESSGPVAKGVCPASMVKRRTPRLQTSQAAS